MSKHINKLDLVKVNYKIPLYQKEYIDLKGREVRKSEQKLSNRKEMGASAVIRELISADISSTPSSVRGISKTI